MRAGDEEPAAIVLHAHGDAPGLRLNEQRSLRCAGFRQHRSCLERSREEALACGRDPLGLQAIGKVDALRKDWSVAALADETTTAIAAKTTRCFVIGAPPIR